MTQARVAVVQKPLASFIFFALTLGDIITTEFALRAGMVEANLLPSYVMETYGRAEMYVLRCLLTAIVFVVAAQLTERYPRVWSSVSISNWLVGGIVFSNTAQLLLA